MGQITIRIDDELEKIIDERRADRPKSDFYRDILFTYVNKPECNKTAGDPIENTSASANNDDARTQLIEHMSGQVRFLEGKLDESNRLLLNEQALHLTTQRLLPPAAKKPWYLFWK